MRYANWWVSRPSWCVHCNNHIFIIGTAPPGCPFFDFALIWILHHCDPFALYDMCHSHRPFRIGRPALQYTLAWFFKPFWLFICLLSPLSSHFLSLWYHCPFIHTFFFEDGLIPFCSDPAKFMVARTLNRLQTCLVARCKHTKIVHGSSYAVFHGNLYGSVSFE